MSSWFKNNLSPVIFRASLVQLVERWSPKPNVEGSSPSGRVNFMYSILFYLIKILESDKFNPIVSEMHYKLNF